MPINEDCLRDIKSMYLSGISIVDILIVFSVPLSASLRDFKVYNVDIYNVNILDPDK